MKFQDHPVIVAALILCASVQSVKARTWHIYSDGSGDAPTVAAAIDSAAAGDTVLVAPGSYITGVDIGLDIDKSIHLISEEGPEKTFLGVLNMYESSTVVSLTNLDANSSLVGFTIRDGHPWWGPAGGIHVRNSSTRILNNIIRGNSYGFGGAGGIYCEGDGSPIIRNNIIYGNQGSALFVDSCSAVIDSNTIAFNEAWGDWMPAGGVVIDSDRPVTITNNIIVYNTGTIAGNPVAGVYCISGSSGIEFTCNCVFGNTPADYGGSYTDQTGMNGNISLDPQFCAVRPDSSGNYYLQSDSPCAPDHHPDGDACGVIGAVHVGCGTTGAERESWGGIKSRYRK